LPQEAACAVAGSGRFGCAGGGCFVGCALASWPGFPALAGWLAGGAVAG